MSTEARVILPDSPYAEIDPPWDCDLLNRISPDTFNHQTQSPLFALLPIELRLEVFSLVLSPYQDISDPYNPEDEHYIGHFFHYYRPDCTAPWKLDTAVLYTCRRAFYESRHMPMRNTTHRFHIWMVCPRNNGRQSESDFLGRVKFQDLTRSNLADVTKVKFITSPHDLSSQPSLSYFDQWEFFRGPNALPGLKEITITLPWTGWLSWSQDVSLYWPSEEMKADGWPNGLEAVRIEAEVPEFNKASREELAEHLRDIRRDVTIKLRDGTVLAVAPEEDTPAPWTWSIPADHVDLLCKEVHILDDILARKTGKDGKIFVATIEWRR